MNIIRNMFQKNAKPTVDKKSAGLGLLGVEYGIDSSGIYVKDERKIEHYRALVAACVDAITRDVVSQGYYFSKIGETEPLDNAKINKNVIAPFISQWNGISLYDAIRLIMPSILMHGNGYIWTRKKQARNALEIRDGAGVEFVPSSSVTPVLRPDGEGVEYYTVYMNSIPHIVSPDEMIHFRQNAISSPFIGVGNISKLRIELDGAKASAEFLAQFMKDANVMPDIIIADYSRGDDEQKKKLGTITRERYRGKIMMFDAQDKADVINTSVMAKDFNFIDSRKYTDDQVLSIFSVPRIILGLPDNSNRSTSSNQIPLYFRSAVNPRLTLLADTFNSQFVWKIDPSIQFNFKMHATGDVDDTVKMLTNGIITPNEAARRMGESANYDDKARNMFYVPAYLATLDNLSISKDIMALQTSISESQDTVAQRASLEGMAKDLSDPRNVTHIVEDMKKRLPAQKMFQTDFVSRALNTRVSITEKYVMQISAYFKKQEVDIIEMIKNKKEVEDYEEIINIEKEMTGYIQRQIGTEAALLLPLYTSGVLRAITDINILTGAGIVATTSNPFAKAMIEKLGEKITGVLTQTTLKDLRAIFKKAIDEGYSINQLQDAISSKFIEYQGRRARLIARTEARLAWDSGAAIAYSDLGFDTFDVVGCTQFEANSDCGKMNIPLSRVLLGLTFHPNHIGVIVPSKRI